MAKDRASSILESARKASGREKKYKTTEKEKEQVSGGQTSTTNTTKKTTDRATSILESARKASGRNTVGGGRTSYSSAASSNSKSVLGETPKTATSNAFGSAGSLGAKAGKDVIGKDSWLLYANAKINEAKSKTTDEYYEKRYKEEYDRLTREHANERYYPTAAQADNIVLKEMKSAQREAEAYEAEKQKYIKLSKLNENTEKILGNVDYEQNSKYSPAKTKQPEELKAEGYKQDVDGKWFKMNWLTGAVDYYNGEDSDLYTYINDDSKRLSLGVEDETLVGMNMYEENGYHTLTEDEKGAFNYLYHQDRINGTNTAEEYLLSIKSMLQDRALKIEAEEYKKWAKESPFSASVVSLGTNFTNAVYFPAKLGATAAGQYDDMPMLDKYGNRTQAIRGAVSEDMGTAGRLFYNAGMSIGDMGLAMLAGGGNAKVVQAIMSSAAGSSAISTAKNNGASDGKAFIMGLGSAAIEWATEKYSVEALLRKPESILGYITTNLATEGTEEGVSNISNVALDLVVSEIFGDRNEIEQRIDYLVVYEDKTPEEAMQIAFNEKLQNLGEDVIVGAMSGFGTSTVTASPAIVQNGFERITRQKPTTTIETQGVTPTPTVETPILTQTTSIDPIEQAAREVVAEKIRNNPALAVETMSINGETITPEDAKKASAYGKYGSELLADAVNKAEGKSFSEVKGEMHIPYMAGYSNQNVNISTDFEQESYFAGKKDRAMDDLAAKEKAKTATVYESGVVKNENFNKLSKASQEVLSTLAKDHKMSVEMQDKIVASIVNGVEKRAAGSHYDGKMGGSMSTEKPLIKWAIHEDGHRMEQMATDEWNVLANALYERAERLGRRSELGLSQGTRFDKMKADHDNAGITKDTSGYFGEVVMRELETIFASPEEFNAWRAELDGNAQVKTAWQKFMDFLVELIDKAKATLAKATMSKEARAQARAGIAELEHIKELYANAYKATSDAVTKRANEVQTDTNSSKNLEIKINEEYNGNISYAMENGENESRPIVIDREGVTDEDVISNSQITKIKMKNFPPYNESQSDANEWSTRWAHQDEVESGAQTIVFYHNRCYVIEKYDSADLKYQIEGRIRYSDYLAIRKELEEDARNSEKQSKKKAANIISKRNGRRTPNEGRGQSPNNYATEHRRKDRGISRLGGKQTGERGAQNNSNRSDEYDSKDRKAKSLKDSEGNTLTEAQQEYFKDSKVRDEDGNLLVMYHCTPNANYTVFKPGTYFTEHKWYADRYQAQGASSLSYKKSADNPNTYAVYLDIKKPFDTRNKAERDIFYNEYYRQYGTGTDLAESGLPDWVDGLDLQEFLEEKGYDYDGLILDEGAVGGFGDEVVSRGVSYVTFKPEQVKNINNLNPTINPDINFSLEEPIEETKNLIAVHNVWEHKLREALELGGLPSPSIAITKKDMSHNKFGEISLVFRKGTISPTDRRNKVYGGDAYTPTRQEINYKISDKVLDKIEERIRGLVDRDIRREFRLSLDDSNVESALKNNNGNFVEAYKGNEALKMAFLKEKGIPFKPVMKTKEISQQADNIVLRRVARAIGDETLKKATQDSKVATAQEPMIRKLLNDRMEEQGAPRIYDKQLSAYQVDNIIYAAREYIREGEKKVVDYYATRDRLDNKFTKKLTAEYENWLNELGEGIIEKKGIRNERDLFTPSGNRRSFDALHWDYTLENIVKSMNGQQSKGSAFWGGNIFGASTKEYGSIADIKADSTRLQEMTDEEYNALKSEYKDRLDDVARAYSNGKDIYDAENALIEAVSTKKTKQGVRSYLAQYDYVYKVTDDIVNDLWELRNDIAEMPVSYFEAKPQRAVGWNEVAAAIIPKSKDKTLKTELEKRGIKVLEYDKNKDGDRSKKVNSVPDVSFSLEETNNTSSKDQKQLLDTIEQLKGQFEVTKFAKADAKKLAKMTRDILKEYDSKADTDETRKAIDELYQYIANGEGQNPAAWNDVYNRAYKIAQNIVENALVTDDYMYQEYKSLRDYLRNTPLKFNSGYDSVPTAYESFNDFRKKNMGRLKFTNDGMSIDSFYQELSSLYPEYFDSEEQTNTADQLERIVDVLDEIQPTEVNPFDGQVQQASMHLANDLINRFFDIPQAKPTFADKAERRVINTRIKAKKQLDRVREQRDIKIEKEKAKRRDSLAKMSEKKKASVLRARIMRHTGELHKTLIKATDQKHIPPELENTVLALLYNINLESNYTYDVYTDSYKKNDKGYPTNKTNAFRALKEVYAEIAKNNDYGLTLASELIDTTNEGVANIFDEVMKLSDKKIADMTSEELTKIYDAIRIVEHSITTANKMFAMKKWEGLSETAKAFEKSVATRRVKPALMKSHLTLDIETPITFFSHFGEAGNELFQAFRDAQDNEQVMIDELAERVQKIVSLEQVQKAEKELFEFTTTEGKKLTLSKAHIMDIYLLYNRKQGKKHLLYDPESEHFGNGIHQPEIKSKHIRRDTESTRLTKADLENIISKLSAEDKAIADKLQKTTLLLAQWGNKACLDVFGYEKFNDPNYWTIKSAKESINQTPEKNKDIARSIKNMGSAKTVEKKATNALDIGGVFNVFNQHASDMITYAAWLGVMEDATKLYNYTFRDEDGHKTNRTFVSMLDKYAGGGGSEYYFNLMKDIQNGIGLAPDTATERIYTKLFGMAAKAKVAYKATVVAQQPMAIVRAASVLNPLSIMRATVKGGANLPAWAVAKVTKDKINASEWYGGWERALKYAPIASRKAIGGYEINANDSGLKGVLYKPDTKKGKAVDALKESPLWAAGKADEITWGILWNACEIETNKDKSLEKGSEEYYEAVAKRFTNVINETQVVDGVLQRSQLMRSSSGWIKPLTTFKGEPTMALNGVMRAYDKVRYEADPAKRGKAIKKFARATTVFLASAVFTAFARSLAVGGTGEDDEEYWKKVWKSFSGIQGDEKTWFDFVKNIGLKSDAVNNINPLTWLPITSELMSAFQGYDVERLDVASVTDFYNEAKKFIDSLDKEGKQTVGYSARQVLLKAAEFTGYSPYNLIRDIEGAIRTVRVETNDVKGLYEMEKWRTRPASNVSKYVDILYRAYSTDSDDYEYIYNDMIENGVDSEKIEDGMEERMKDAEGVKKVSELTKRYMSPDVEKKYDNSLSKIRTSDVWKKANATQRKEAEADLYNFLTSDSEDMEKAREEAMLNGVDSSEYALWQIAIEMADQPKDENGSGSYDSKEKAEAINSLNLGKKEMAYFYGKGLNKYAKDELNQVISDKIDIQDYINFKAATSDMTADKNANGKSIRNSKKSKIVNYLNSANLTDEEWNYFYYEIMDYKK